MSRFKVRGWLSGILTVAIAGVGVGVTTATEASGATCTRSWAAAVNGEWGTAANWVPSGVPVATDGVCINKSGNYVVTISGLGAVAATVDLGVLSTSGSQKLQLSSSSLTVPGGITIGARGDLAVGLASDGQYSSVVAPVTNNGVVSFPAGSGQSLTGNLTNNATINDASASLGVQSPSVWVNKGTFNVSGGATQFKTGTTFTNGVGGNVVNSGAVTVSGVWNQSGGAVSGANPISLQAATLNSASGSGSFFFNGSNGNVLAGTVPVGMSVSVGNASLGLQGTVVNNGSLSLITFGGQGSSLSGALTNNGTLDFPAGGSSRSVTGTITNNGTVSVRSDATFQAASTLTNNGVVDLGTSTLSINGAFSPSVTSVVATTATATLRGVLSLTTNVTLAGSLRIDTPSTYTPTVGTTFDPITTSATRTGSFATIAGVMLSPTLRWNVSTTANKVTATAAVTSGSLSLSVSWSAAETTRIAQMAPQLGVAPAAVQKASVFTLAFLLGFGSPTPTPVTLAPAGVATVYSNSWTTADLSVLQTVKAKYVLNDADAQRFSVALIDYLLALGGH